VRANSRNTGLAPHGGWYSNWNT